MLDKQRHAQPDRLRYFVPDVPEQLEQLILQLLEKDPERRVRNARITGRRLSVMLKALGDEGQGAAAASGDVPAADGRPPADDTPEPPSDENADERPAGATQQSAPFSQEESGGNWNPTVPDGPPLPEESQAQDGLARTVDTPAPSDGPGESADGNGDAPDDSVAPVHQRPSSERRSESQLPQTKRTAAFEGLPVLGGAPSADKTVSADATVDRPKSEFTPVRRRDLDPPVPEESEYQALISPHTWILALSLVLVGVGAWYVLQPPSADTLYERINEATADGTADSLLDAEEDIREFLMRYAEDPRADTLRQYVQEIELHRLERRFERRLRGLGTTERLLPIERDYLEALHYVRIDRERGMDMLQALIDLYGHGADRSGPIGRCVELAQRRLEQIEKSVARSAPNHLEMIGHSLDQAEELAQENPARARQMFEAAIELYGDKHWAAPAVARARAALADLGPADESADRSTTSAPY
jgi:serine/threonine-protein kinase